MDVFTHIAPELEIGTGAGESACAVTCHSVEGIENTSRADIPFSTWLHHLIFHLLFLLAL